MTNFIVIYIIIIAVYVKSAVSRTSDFTVLNCNSAALCDECASSRILYGKSVKRYIICIHLNKIPSILRISNLRICYISVRIEIKQPFRTYIILSGNINLIKNIAEIVTSALAILLIARRNRNRNPTVFLIVFGKYGASLNPVNLKMSFKQNSFSRMPCRDNIVGIARKWLGTVLTYRRNICKLQRRFIRIPRVRVPG